MADYLPAFYRRPNGESDIEQVLILKEPDAVGFVMPDGAELSFDLEPLRAVLEPQMREVA